MDATTLIAIIQGLMGLLLCIVGWTYKDLKFKVDKTHEEFLLYKVVVATSYIGNEELKQVVDNLTRGIDGVQASLLRVENRLNLQLDRRSGDSSPH